MEKSNHLIHLLKGQRKDIGGGLTISRFLPRAQLRSVGPFVFLDFIGPAQLSHETAMDVRPHPHIGLATVTYFFSGQGLHRDSLGNVARIQPGDLAIMTSGRGIAHSERTPPEDRTPNGPTLHGIQLWMALPKTLEDTEPRFEHWPAHQFSEVQIPTETQNKEHHASAIRVLTGEIEGFSSSFRTDTNALLADLRLKANSRHELRLSDDEVGLLLISGHATIDSLQPNNETTSTDLTPESLWINLRPGSKKVRIHAIDEARIVILGGPRLDEPRHMWWNFVSTDKEKIRRAAQRWKDGLFDKVPGETEFIPLPDGPI